MENRKGESEALEMEDKKKGKKGGLKKKQEAVES